jgi:UDP-perosamine 4-acetyltransferase
MTSVVGIGAGGHAKVVIEILRAGGRYEPTALVDANPALWGTEVLGVPVVGGDDALGGLLDNGANHAFIGMGFLGETSVRQGAVQKVEQLGFELVQAIHPSAVLSPSAHLGAGITIMAHGIVNAEARIGSYAIVNSGAIVEHDCRIGDHAHVGPGARLAANVSVGERTHLGIGATVRQGLTIGDGSVVGAGAVVVRDVPEDVVVAGVPAKTLREVAG